VAVKKGYNLCYKKERMVYGDKEVLLNMSSVIDIKENKYLLILVYNPNHYGSIRFEFEGLSYEEILPNKEYYILYVNVPEASDPKAIAENIKLL
jgi:hypothetical protein